jgi:hypothetical protein
LWHGAPWIEFNVVEPAMAAYPSVTPTTPVEGPVTMGAASGAATEMLSLVSVACAVLISVVALAAGATRRSVHQ